MDTQNTLHENISALVDGELPQSEQELAFAALGTAEGQAAWRAYHLTGDVLRDSVDGALSDSFNAHLAARLAREPDSEAPSYGRDRSGQGGPAGRSDNAGGAPGPSGAACASARSPLPEDQGAPRADVILP